MTSSIEYQRDEVIDDRYRVLSKLGRGGMGLVYKVEQIFIKKQFALKTIDSRLLSEKVVRRFQQEAKASFALKHPNIVAVNDFGVLDGQSPFLVMELINGETLADRLETGGALTIDIALPIFIQICFALAYAHELGIVHRDIKPSNIMLVSGVKPGTDGSIKILDFGLAKFTLHEEGEIQALTRTGEIFGSPMYMSPEQCSGLRADHRTDIYSLGCVIFEALTGKPPFVGDSALSTMILHQSERPRTLKEATGGGKFPQALEDIVACMLSKSPDKRYSNLGQLVQDLSAIKSGAMPTSSTLKGVRVEAQAKAGLTSMRRVSLILLMAGVAVASTTLGAFGTYCYMMPQFNRQENIDKAAESGPIPAPIPIQADDFRIYPLQDRTLEYALNNQTAKSTQEFALEGSQRAVTINAEQLKKIAGTTWIRSVRLSGFVFKNRDLAEIRKMPIHELLIGNSTLNDEGARYVSELREIRHLGISATDITDDGIFLLARLPHLDTLDVSKTRVTNRSFKALSENSSLMKIIANDCKAITDDGVSYFRGKQIVELCLSGTNITDKSMETIGTIRNLNTVMLDRTVISTDGIISMLRANLGVRRVLVTNCKNVNIKLLRKQFPQCEFFIRVPEAVSPSAVQMLGIGSK
ncbi:MAG TPA: protein kinase [Oculatellaceae cyanobacterium]